MEGGEFGSTSKAIDSSNVGFKLLKKCGWKEGSGLGVSEQGRLEPLQPHVKKNKSGIGAEKTKRKTEKFQDDNSNNLRTNKSSPQPKKSKLASKRIRKMLEEDERMKEREFQMAFFREFWPDNV